jgi:hypothetical protein
MRFKAFVKFENIGYSYESSCDIIPLVAKTVETAIAEFKSIVQDEFIGESKLEEATIFGVEVEVSTPLEKWYEEIEGSVEEAEERAEYERLKKKFDSS